MAAASFTSFKKKSLSLQETQKEYYYVNKLKSFILIVLIRDSSGVRINTNINALL